MRKWALVSVFDKTGITEFCQALVGLGYGILSTGGTAKHLAAAGISVTPVEDYTGFPEMMDGRVKTLHPKIHGGLLGLRDDAAHIEAMKTHGIDAIDIVVVNLYPFEKTTQKPDVRFEECVEMIDIGGPSMLRSAAKNHRFTLPVIDPSDYASVTTALQSGEVPQAMRMQLAAKVFSHTSAYDGLIANYLSKEATLSKSATESPHVIHWPPALNLSFVSKQALRYGENPHQSAHFYQDAAASETTIAGAHQLQGKELSYNNIQDADAALSILRAFDDFASPVVVAVKHMNPCGIGRGDNLIEAYQCAYEADPVSIFGGIVALNRPVDAAVAAKLTELFLEIVIAPGFTEEALQRFAKKKNVRLLVVRVDTPLWQKDDVLYRRVSGGLLVQQVDHGGEAEWRVVTKVSPTPEQWNALRFAWKTVQYVKSNAIVLTTDAYTVGIGAGQMNRVGAARIAIEAAGARAVDSVMGSDAFFPMRDTVDVAAAAGVAAIVQPGGSIRDEESITAADEHGIAMVFTGQRHFMH